MNGKKNQLLILFFTIGVFCNAQIQVGSDIEGDIVHDNFGVSVSMSANGKIVAIGGHTYTDQTYSAGIVRVYEFENGEWVQLGRDLFGKEKRDWFGFSVAISGDGTRLIVGSYNANEVVVYEYKNSDWIQVGQLIRGQGFNSGNEVAISSDGNVIAVRAVSLPQSYAPQYQYLKVMVRIFKLADGQWSQFGEIMGGSEVSFSSDGKTVAFGSANAKIDDFAGEVKVFRNNGNEWVLLGNSIKGKGNKYLFGNSLSLSESGNRIVVGAPGSSHFTERPCYIGVYEFIDGNWSTVGQEIDGYINEGFGSDVVISTDGNRIAVSSPNNRNCPVRFFDFVEGTWKQVGQPIKNTGEIVLMGYSIDMSEDGNLVAATSIHSNTAQVYDISNIIFEKDLTEGCKYENEVEEEDEENQGTETATYTLYPNPTTGQLIIKNVDLESLLYNNKLKLFDALGRRIGDIEVKENLIDLTHLPTGTYFLVIDEKVERVIKFGFYN